MIENAHCVKVEDMLKRSFAEFHAQKAQPESRLALERGQKALAAIKARPLPEALHGTSREDVRQFHNISQDIQDLSNEVQVHLPPPLILPNNHTFLQLIPRIE